MPCDVRVILVGRTGLDAKLRLDPAIELVRVRTPLEAIGELADPVDDYSPMRAVVIIGPEIYAEPSVSLDPRPDFTLHGTAMEDFVRALRLVDPNVRVFQAVESNAANSGPPHEPGTAPTAPYYDYVIPADMPVDALRRIVRSGIEPGVGTQVPAAPETRMSEIQHSWMMSDAHTPRAAEVEAHAGMPASNAGGATDVGDAELVRISLKGGDLRVSALRLVCERLNDPSITLTEQPIGPTSAPVVCEGKSFGFLNASLAALNDLELHATWLGAWVRLGEQQLQMREAAFTDPLTGAWNRRYFDKFLSAAIERARTGRQSVTLLVFDIDNFKQYNDRFGHAAADEILVESVRLLRSVIRPSDRVCRIGGDEFAVIFHEPAGPRTPGSSPPSSVFEIAQRFQGQIRQQRFPKLGIDAPGSLTISGGLATFPWDGTSVADLLRRADELAIESKRSGKNAIMFGPGAAGGGLGT